MRHWAFAARMRKGGRPTLGDAPAIADAEMGGAVTTARGAPLQREGRGQV
jgi:hypothetical protein